MIIQIKDKGKWYDRCQCQTQSEAENEIDKLKKIFKFNEFRWVDKENPSIPKTKYVNKTDQEIEDIVKGVDVLTRYRGIKDTGFIDKVIKVLAGNNN